MLRIEDVMRALSKTREIFHSEADFQHAMAWEIHRRLPEAYVTLERPYRTGSVTLHLDMLVRTARESLAIELKYKTRKLEHQTPDESYVLLNQSAQDVGRYDYIKDIWRLEQITRAVPSCHGWAILLANDSSYWKTSKRMDTVDASFRLSEGGALHGTVAWGALASAGTMKSREKPIELRGNYKLQWADYSSPAAGPNGQFRYLAIEVHENGSDH